MRIWVLAENTACREDLTAEHGLSLYIETAHHRILFDAGQSAVFAENAEKMGIDLAKVDFAVLSHGHYDHGGGLSRFLQINPTAPVYVHRDAFAPHYHGPEKYIGLNTALLDSGRLILTGSNTRIAPGVALSVCKAQPYGTDSTNLTVLRDGVFCPDDFSHEQYLLIEEHGRRIL